MRYVKMLALAAVAAGALMAFIGAGTASASKLCSTTADPCPAGQSWPVNTVLDFSIPSGGSVILEEPNGTSINTCTNSTVKGKISNAGSATETVTGAVEVLTFTGCNFPTTVIKRAGLEIHKIAGTSNGTVTSDGLFEVTINTIFFGTCVYGVTNEGSIGDLTEGNPAIFHANATVHKLSGSNFACPENTLWTGTYTLTEPTNTTLSVSSS